MMIILKVNNDNHKEPVVTAAQRTTRRSPASCLVRLFHALDLCPPCPLRRRNSPGVSLLRWPASAEDDRRRKRPVRWTVWYIARISAKLLIFDPAASKISSYRV